MKSRTRLQSYRALIKDQLILNKPNIKKNTTLAPPDMERVFGKEVSNFEKNRENFNHVNLEIMGGRRVVSRSLAYQKPRPKSVYRKESTLIQAVSPPVQVKDNLAIPEHVSEYYHEIIYHLMKITMATHRLDSSYMNLQKQLKVQNRQDLITELVQIHSKFKLLPSTLFKTISLLDNYLNQNYDVQKRRLDLIGLSCLFIAAKYEQIYPPSMKHYIEACGKRFSNLQIIDMESKILKQNNFNICNNTTSQFINMLALQFSFSEKQRYFCMYIAELSLYNIQTVHFHPIQIALSCGAVVCSLMKQDILNAFDRQDDKNITECSKLILKIFKESSNLSKSVNTKKKFSKEQYLQVGKLSSFDN